MATYVMLAHFTDQGVKSVKDTVTRAEAFKQSAKKHGATVKELLWTLGAYDVEAPDEATVTALGLSVGTLGNVRTQTLRAFSEAEMKTIINKMA